MVFQIENTYPVLFCHIDEVSMAKQRVAEAEKLGFEECVVPLVSLEECKKGSKIRVIGVSSVQDAVDKVFG